MRGLLFWGALVSFASASPAAAVESTAVFTLDTHRVKLSGAPDLDPAARLAARVEQCRIVPGEEPLFRLDCPAEPKDDAPGRPAVITLFRDLRETVYLAACPLIETGEDNERDPDEVRAGEESLIDKLCSDIEPGRTFSAEADGADELRLVIRGRQVRLRLFETRPRPQGISESYAPKPSKGSLGPAGPSARSVGAPAPNPPDPEWDPARAAEASRAGTRLAEPSLRDPEPARTSLGAGVVAIRCPRGADVWIDGAHLGACPIRLPLAAGRHEIVVKRKDRVLASREIRLEAGASLDIRLPE